MATPETRHLLKVFSGPHVGAEVLLVEGTHILGSGDDCDIILEDRLIAERHVQISVSGDDVSFESIGDAKVYIDGKEVAAGPLEAFQYFTVGNTHLAIGPSDQTWPNHDFPGYQLVATDSSDSEASGDSDESDGSSVRTDEGGESRQEASQDGGAAATPAGSGTSEVETPQASGTRWKGILAVSIVFVLFAISATAFVISTLSDDSSVAATPLTLSDVEAVVQADAGAADSSVSVVEEDGSIRVEGFVADRSVKKRLSDALLDLLDSHPQADLEIKIADTKALAASVQDVVDMFASKQPTLGDLRVSPGKPGEVVVAGEIADLSVWPRVRTAIRNDVSRLKELDDTQVTQIGSTPAASGEDPAIAQSTSVEAPPPEPEVDETIESTSPTVPDPPRPPVVEDSHELPQLSIVRVVGRGRRRLMTMADGVTVFEGSRITGGYVVKSIQPDQVILSHNGIEHSISLSNTP